MELFNILPSCPIHAVVTMIDGGKEDWSRNATPTPTPFFTSKSNF